MNRSLVMYKRMILPESNSASKATRPVSIRVHDTRIDKVESLSAAGNKTPKPAISRPLDELFASACLTHRQLVYKRATTNKGCRIPPTITFSLSLTVA